jgi:hypothetical protein
VLGIKIVVPKARKKEAPSCAAGTVILPMPPQVVLVGFTTK